jgi:hypothetical protein
MFALYSIYLKLMDNWVSLPVPMAPERSRYCYGTDKLLVRSMRSQRGYAPQALDIRP